MSPQADFGQQIYAEQVALLYRNATAGYLVSIAGGALLVFALSTQVDLALLLTWYGLPDRGHLTAFDAFLAVRARLR
jgi:hypothetical protein